MLKIRPAGYLFIMLLTATLLTPRAGFCQAEGATLKVAVVDIGTVSDQYQALNMKDEELKAWQTDKLQYVASLEDFAFLAQEHFLEAQQILELSTPLPEERAARLAELREISSQKLERFLELRAKVERTAQEEDEFNSLQEVAAARDNDLAAIAEELNAQYQQKLQQARAELLQEVERVITAYAQQYNYDLVLDRQGVLYGGEDITDRIIERLNEPAAGGDETEEAEAPAEPPPAKPTEGGEGEAGGDG